jgi:hypothetical protein
VTVLIYKKLEILDRQTLSKQAAKEKKAVVLDAVRMKLGTPKK